MVTRSVSAVWILFALFLFLSCAGNADVRTGAVSNLKESDIPLWAQSSGKRLTHIYRYFPSSGIYYDTGRGIYFYLRDGKWKTAASIPSGKSMDIGCFISFEMDTDEPYVYHDEIKNKYPVNRKKECL